MIPEIHRVRELQQSFLATMPYPDGDDKLAEELRGLAGLGVDILVSLLEPFETEAFGLTMTGVLAAEVGIEFVSHPIPDHDVPVQPQEFANLAFDLSDRLSSGSSVAVHCVGGIGRSTLLAAAIMADLGDDFETLFQRISSVRGFPVPDTTAQIAWFSEMCSLLDLAQLADDRPLLAEKADSRLRSLTR